MSSAQTDNPPEEIKKHPLALSIVLHLLPGILTGAAYFALVRPVRNLGFPSVGALILASLVALVPFELGYLLIQRKKTGTRKFEQERGRHAQEFLSVYT